MSTIDQKRAIERQNKAWATKKPRPKAISNPSHPWMAQDKRVTWKKDKDDDYRT